MDLLYRRFAKISTNALKKNAQYELAHQIIHHIYAHFLTALWLWELPDTTLYRGNRIII